MKTIKRINILSVAKIWGLIVGGIYLVIGLIINAAFLFNIQSLAQFDILGFGSGILATFLVVIVVGALAFAFGALMAWLYNISAKLVGGISWEETESGIDANHKPAASFGHFAEKPKPQDEVNSILDSHKKNQETDNYHL